MERDIAAYLFTLFCPLFTSDASFSIAHEYSVKKVNLLATEYTYSLAGWPRKDHVMQPTDDWQLLNISDWRVSGAPWTRGHWQDDILRSSCCSWSVNSTVSKFMWQPLKTSLVPTFTWKFFHQLLCSAQTQIINQNMVFIERDVYIHNSDGSKYVISTTLNNCKEK